jgi:hypothetical protein
MNREPWYESTNPTRVARGASWRIAVWILAIIVFAGLISGGVWLAKVLLSEPKGAGDQELIVNDGRNRVNAQEWFASQYGQILAADRNLDEAAANVAANPDDPFYRTNYTGLKNRCVDMVTAYNAEAAKISRGKWISPDFPSRIDETDPKTDCKESAK